MEFKEWTEKYTVGNPLVDAYHHIFFQMVDEFRKAAAEACPPPMGDRIDFLVDYTLMHFDSEERWMARVGYPDVDAHSETHRAFREQILDLQRRYREDPGAISVEEVLFLVQDWFSSHILGSDMAFKDYGRKD
jgi:hemerythrin